MSQSDRREENAIHAVECPQCHARAGLDCYYQGQPTRWLNGRRYCHPERRELHGRRARVEYRPGRWPE
jgi:hypothetical protein